MKYFIGVNQKIWLDKYPEADIETALIFDIIKNFCALRNKKIKKLILDNEEYTWINYQMIIDELPMLRFRSKGSISSRVNLLKKIGLIKPFRAPEGSIYIRLTEKASELIFDIPVHLDEQIVSVDTQPVHVDEQPPVHVDEQHNQTTNINQTTILPKGREKVSYGNQDINDLILLLKEKNHGLIDGPERENRQYCWVLLKKFGYSKDKEKAKNGIIAIIEFATKSSFHAKNATNFKYLFRHAAAIIADYEDKQKVEKKSKFVFI
jgi:hypothetical protein